MKSSHAWGRRAVVSLTLVALLVGGAWRGALPVGAHAEHGQPARIHLGTCAAIGASVFTLNGLGAEVAAADDAPLATPELTGPQTAAEVAVSVTTIDAPLGGIVDGGHALMVYASDSDLTAVACGDIGGPRFGDDLIVGLRESNHSGQSGIAIFRDAGDQTTVSIYLASGLAGESAEEHAEGEDHHAEATPIAG